MSGHGFQLHNRIDKLVKFLTSNILITFKDKSYKIDFFFIRHFILN